MTFGPLHTKKLVKLLESQPTLKLVTYAEIAKVIGEPYPSPTAYHSFAAARDVLMNTHGKLVLTVRGKGVFVADDATKEAHLYYESRKKPLLRLAA